MEAIDAFCDRPELLSLFTAGLQSSIDASTLLRWLQHHASLPLDSLRAVLTHPVSTFPPLEP